MKNCSPLIMALAIACAGASQADEWVSLAAIGDKLELKAGETAMIVSVSEQTEILFDKPGRSRCSFPLNPEDQRNFVAYPYRNPPNRASASYSNPFVLAGPGVITVSCPSVITMKLIRPQQVPIVRTRSAAPKLAPRPPVRRLPTKATGWAALTK
jgi:hypothetical protein